MASPKESTMLVRSVELDCRAVEGQPNQFEISFSSEAPYMRGGFQEILLHEQGSVDLSRFDSGMGALLFAHGRDPNYGKVPIGSVVRAWLDESARKCRAIISFDEDDDSCTRLKNKLEKGILKGVSVGYRVGAWTELLAGQRSADGRFSGPAEIASVWTPHEISLEPIPADFSVGFGKSMENDEEEKSMSMKESDKTIERGVTQQEGAVKEPFVLQPSTDVAAVERARSLEISSLCRSFEIDPTEYIKNGDSIDAVRAAILDGIQKKNAPVQVGGEDVQIVADEGDKLRAAATDGLLLRCNQSVNAAAPGASEFRGMSLQNIAIECLMRSGVTNANRLDKTELFRRSMTPDSAFSAIAANVANRVVLSSHETAPTTFQHWTSKASSTDFRPTDIYEISEAGDLVEIPQNGEFKEARLSDKAVATRRLLTFGRMITFTRQMFINDDIEMISRTLAKFTLAFSRGTNKAVYEILRKNPTVYDGAALFSSGHGNLGTAAVPGTNSFAEARRMMRKQKDIGNQAYLNIAPAYVLTSAADETAVEKLLVSLADPSASNSGVANVFRNKMIPIVDAELDVDTGAQPYYFAADPRLADTIEVAYLNGNESPTVETQPSFDELGIKFRVFGDRAVTLLGYKGLFKNPGQAQ